MSDINNLVETAETIDADGWLHTGDVGTLDVRGYLRITDRLKDMFIVGGFNCYPAEIEAVLTEHPALAQIAVLGVPDEDHQRFRKGFGLSGTVGEVGAGGDAVLDGGLRGESEAGEVHQGAAAEVVDDDNGDYDDDEPGSRDQAAQSTAAQDRAAQNSDARIPGPHTPAPNDSVDVVRRP